MVLADAKTCFFLMVAPAPYDIQAVTTDPCFEYIAAALAIVCGYFRYQGGKRNGKPNYSAAAARLGQATNHPAQVCASIYLLAAATLPH